MKMEQTANILISGKNRMWDSTDLIKHSLKGEITINVQ